MTEISNFRFLMDLCNLDFPECDVTISGKYVFMSVCVTHVLQPPKRTD